MECHVFGVIEESLWEEHDHVSMTATLESEKGKQVANNVGKLNGHSHSAIGYAECRMKNGTTLFLAVDPVSLSVHPLKMRRRGML